MSIFDIIETEEAAKEQTQTTKQPTSLDDLGILTHSEPGVQRLHKFWFDLDHAKEAIYESIERFFARLAPTRNQDGGQAEVFAAVVGNCNGLQYSNTINDQFGNVSAMWGEE